ncbi:MAG: PEP-CTERM sorting domain-containing protein [Pseudomonadota bacterium]
MNASPLLFGGLGGIRDLNVDRITLDLRVREVPEPSTLALAALALAGLGVTVRRRRR